MEASCPKYDVWYPLSALNDCKELVEEYEDFHKGNTLVRQDCTPHCSTVDQDSSVKETLPDHRKKKAIRAIANTISTIVSKSPRTAT